MSVSLLPLDVDNDTWGDAVARINQIIDVLGEKALTANSNPTTGNSELIGSFFANNIFQANTKVASSNVTFTAGTGLTGGGNLSTDRTLSLSANTIATLDKANSALQAVTSDSNNTIVVNNANTNAPRVSANTDTLMTVSLYDSEKKRVNVYNRSNHTGTAPLNSLDPGSNGAFVVGRTGSTGDVTRVSLSSAASNNSIAYRTATGTLQATDPTTSSDVATKNYTDTALANKADKTTTLTTKTNIPSSGANLNTYTETGLYRQETATPSGTNYPILMGGVLEVMSNSTGSEITQRYTTYRFGNPAPYVFVRGYSSSTWGSWQNVSAPIVSSTTPSNPAEGTVWYQI